MVTKIIFAGEGGVGKTSLVKKYLGDNMSTNITLGVDFYSIKVGNYSVIIWDLSGQERFKYLLESFFYGAKLAVFVFDLTRPLTLIRLENWINLIRKTVSKIDVILVGNKKDLGKKVDDGLITEFINKINSSRYRIVEYIETSAFTGENVNALFHSIKKVLSREKGVIKEVKITI